MQQRAIVVGLGQLGVVFSEGLLREGWRVLPVLRRTERAEYESEEAALCVVAVGEDDLAPAVAALPERHRRCAVLLQNELRPLTLDRVGLSDATVCIVWFEKKPGKLLTEVRPSVVAGPGKETLARVLSHVGVQVMSADGEAEVAHQLVLKNLYILGLNLFGLSASLDGGRTLVAGDLLGDDSFDELVAELLHLEQSALTASHFRVVLDGGRLGDDLRAAIAADSEHGCAGRSAPARLQRTRDLAQQLGVAMPRLDRLAQRVAARG